MNVDTGKIKDMSELEKLYEAQAERIEDWEPLPDDLTEAERTELQRPMNRHERRAAIRLLRLQRKAAQIHNQE